MQPTPDIVTRRLRIGQLIRVFIAVIAAIAVVAILLPDSPLAHGNLFGATLGSDALMRSSTIVGSLMNASSHLAACAIAVVILWARREDMASLLLALVMVLGALRFGIVTAFPEAMGLDVPATGAGAFMATLFAMLMASTALESAGWARLSVMFPSPLSRDALVTRIRTWLEQLDARDAVDRGGRHVLLTILMRPLRPRRRRALRDAIVREGRGCSSWEAGLLRLPGNRAGMPWTALRLGGVLAAAAAVAAMLDPALYPIVPAIVSLVGLALYAQAACYAAISLYTSPAADQRRLLWLVAAYLVLLANTVLPFLLALVQGGVAELIVRSGLATPLDLAPIWWHLETLTHLFRGVCALSFTAALALAVFRDGLLDPGLVIRSATIYALMILVMTGLFLVIEAGMYSVAVAHLHMPGSSGPLSGGVIVAVTLSPVRRRVESVAQAWLSRWMPARALAEARRKDCAVVFCDLSGYTRVSAADEGRALTLVSMFHREAARSARRHRGRVVKTIGDAVLLDFGDVNHAIEACREIPRTFQSACAALGFEELPLRMGVHYGAVACAHDGDLYGATVNLSARLQTSARPGEIIASAAVVERMHAPVRAVFLEAKTLKNVPEPVPSYRIES